MFYMFNLDIGSVLRYFYLPSLSLLFLTTNFPILFSTPLVGDSEGCPAEFSLLDLFSLGYLLSIYFRIWVDLVANLVFPVDFFLF